MSAGRRRPDLWWERFDEHMFLWCTLAAFPLIGLVALVVALVAEMVQ